MLGVGVGTLSAGATANPVVGVAVWKGVTFVGDTVLCIGLGKIRDDALSWGESLESNHQVNVARDIVNRGKCLLQTKRNVRGTEWSAVTCPPGSRGSSPPVTHYKGQTSQGNAITAELTPDGRGLKLKGTHVYGCTGWNPYGIYESGFTFDRNRPAVQVDRTFALNRTWTDRSNTAYFPWTFDEAWMISGSLSADGRQVTGQVSSTITDHRPEKFATPGNWDQREVPAPGFGDPTVCTSSVTFSATAVR